jgi:chromosome segregation ATPase
MTGLEMKYFVLKPSGGSPYHQASRNAMREYAKHIRRENPELYYDLEKWAIKDQGTANHRNLKARLEANAQQGRYEKEMQRLNEIAKAMLEGKNEEIERLSAELERAQEQLDRFEALADKKIDQAQKRIEQLEAALQDLYAVQNGPPLGFYKEHWEVAYEAAGKLLASESINQQDKINE